MRQFIERDFGDTAGILLELEEAVADFKESPSECDPFELQALCDFLRANPLGLADMDGISLKDACRVLRQLADEGERISVLLELVVNSERSVELFAFLVELSAGTARRHELIDALIVQRWGGAELCDLDLEQFSQWFDGADDFKYLIEKHGKYLADSAEEPSLPFDPTTYWIERVRRHIVRCDFRRAWDEWRHAMRGFYFGKPEQLRLGKADPHDYRFQAPSGVCDVLIRELIDAMVVMGELKPPKPGEHLAEKVRLHMLHERAARRRRKVARRLHAVPSPLWG